ncbi:MAG: hypothetical protein HQK50_14210 [Oligoflexia bacterium]|nr:hypothetical protein [Oligoflexia bacterium]MBF0366723.1 hypothetical protein [Oligoflexia bacterium]
MTKPIFEEYTISIEVNNHHIRLLRIGRHYLEKHSADMSDTLIIDLAYALHGHQFEVDSTTKGIEYFIADVEHGSPVKIYRLIFLIEGEQMEILGIVNAYRRSKRSKK